MQVKPGDRVRIVDGSDRTHFLTDGSTGIVVGADSYGFVEVFGKSAFFDKGYGTQMLRREEFEALAC